jgi:hypothetical protein
MNRETIEQVIETLDEEIAGQVRRYRNAVQDMQVSAKDTVGKKRLTKEVRSEMDRLGHLRAAFGSCKAAIKGE